VPGDVAEMLAKAVGVNDRLRRTEGKNRLLPGAERENRPLPCSDRAGGRACRERLFRQLGRCLVYAPLIPFDLSAEAVAVSGGELFAKVLNSSASNDPPSFNERYEWAFGGQYDGGTAYTRLDSVVVQLSEDLHFRTFVNPSHVEVVAIDVMPDDDTNFIAPRSRGVIPVSILTTDTLDATTVDSTTVRFGRTGTEAAAVQSSLKDINRDGRPDLILHFGTQETDFQCEDASASLSGNTTSGQLIQGSDAIVTEGCH
jgi:hypothetical protein